MLSSETQVGVAGSLLLVATYGVLAAWSDPASSASLEPAALMTFAAPAFVVGAVVAVVARWYVPPDRRSRRAHVRTVVTMVLGPTVVFAVFIALVALVLGVVTDALGQAESMAQGATGAAAPLSALGAIMLFAALVIAVVVLVAVIVLLVVLAVVLQLGVVAGYGLATVALDRLEWPTPRGRPRRDPPD